jgi:endo-1,3(4)-beta-glucanase
MMGKMNATFVDAYGEKVDEIMHDVAHNSNINDGSFFPMARHMSWFDGHSFASGLFPFSNGKSQESSSEAVNCYYAATLWSLVRSGSAENPAADVSVTTDFARLLLAMEVRGAKTYWHMMPPSPNGGSSSSSSNSTNIGPASPAVYSPTFAENYMVGNLGMLDVICSTWFGTENLYVHMINFMPVTPITRELFDKDYVSNEYGTVVSQYLNVEMAWRGYVVCDHALVSPMHAWGEALGLISSQLDSGLSRSQVLYFILTSPSGINASQIEINESSAHDDATVPDRSTGDKSSGGSGADCSSHSACVDTGLAGLCCPTSGGAFLYCCNGS